MAKKITKKKTTNKKTTNKKTNSRTKKGLHRKKTKINKKKLAVLVVSTLILLFGIGFICKTTVGFVGKIWPNVVYLKNNLLGSEVDVSDVNSDEQYDMGDEKEETLQIKHNIFIDAGCGGREKGYVASDDTMEKDINLIIAQKVAKRLAQESDINVILSRQEDTYLSIDERKSLAEDEDAEAFVSINLGSENTGKATGIQTIYHTESKDGSSDFATVVQNSMAAYVNIKNRGIVSYQMKLLSENTMPSIYIQCGFLSNDDDREKLKDEEYQNNIAEGIAQGIMTYIDAKK